MKGKAVAVMKSLFQTSLIIVFAAGAVAGTLVLPPKTTVSTRTSKRSRFPVSCYLSTSRSGSTRNGYSHLFDGKSTRTIIPQDDAYWEKPLALARGRAFVKSIMENEYEPIPDSDDMSVLRNVVKLESGRIRDVVVRSITIPFWQKCIEKFNDPIMTYRVAAIGTPGIGKTSTTPILIRMLLKEGITVVYLIRSIDEDDWYYEFIPGPNNSIVTNVYPEDIDKYLIPSLWVNSTYYIVDPSQTMDSCNPSTNFKPKIILVTSPDSGHWGGSGFEKFRHYTAGTFLFLPLWSLAELLSAQPVLGPTMTEGDVKANYDSFGGIPQHVFGSATSKADALKAQDMVLNILDQRMVDYIAKGNIDFLDLLLYVPARSALLGYCLADDDKGTFSKNKVVLLSPLVKEKLNTRFLTDL